MYRETEMKMGGGERDKGRERKRGERECDGRQ